MNPLTEILPAQARKYLYAVLFVAGLGFAAWQAAEGDWLTFIPAIVASLTGAVAGSNVTPAADAEVLDVQDEPASVATLDHDTAQAMRKAELVAYVSGGSSGETPTQE